MRSLLVLPLILALSLGGCGKSEGGPNAGFDGDDGPVRYFGHPADAVDARAIAALVERYYKTAAAEDGEEGCRLLYSLIAETLVEEYGHVPSVRGNTCAEVLSKLFKNNHAEVLLNLAKFQPISIRVSGEHGLAMYRIAPTTIRRALVRREHGVWTIDALLDVTLP